MTSQVAAFGDRVVASSSNVAERPILRAPGAAPAALVTAAPDLELLAGLEPRPHACTPTSQKCDADKSGRWRMAGIVRNRAVLV